MCVSKEIGLLAGLSMVLLGGPVTMAEKPNVLLVMFDDMNDLGFPGAQPKTPNLDAFRQSAIMFTRNQCAAPLCNPSRCSMLSGVSPHVSQVLTNDQNPWASGGVFATLETLPGCFKRNGYRTVTAGKIFHAANHFTTAQKNAMFTDHRFMGGDYGPLTSWAIPENEGGTQWRNIQQWDGPDSDFPDVTNTDAIIAELGITGRSEPFFISLGLYRPHQPYTAPRRFFQTHSMSEVILPTCPEDDLDDVPATGQDWADGANFSTLKANGWWQSLLHAYYSCISFADWNFGRVMAALDSSPYANNTIVIVCSDNGFHNGEKDCWFKNMLWEKSAHTLLMVRAPGITTPGATSNEAVSLIHLYPTLVDLCGLSPPAHSFDGQTMRNLLNGSAAYFNFPALTCAREFGNYALRDEQYRYIRYSNGTEELYDHNIDPNEWVNVAGNPNYAAAKNGLISYVPALTSISSEDGYVVESSEVSDVGGSVNATAFGTAALRIGDTTDRKQYKTILSFDTSCIPDGATIDSATLQMKRGTMAGNPSGLGEIKADIVTGSWSGNSTLQPHDFEVLGDGSGVATFNYPTNNGHWASGPLTAVGRTKINKTGRTQFRIRFVIDDNNDAVADYLGFYSGDETPANRAKLILTFH